MYELLNITLPTFRLATALSGWTQAPLDIQKQMPDLHDKTKL